MNDGYEEKSLKQLLLGLPEAHLKEMEKKGILPKGRETGSRVSTLIKGKIADAFSSHRCVTGPYPSQHHSKVCASRQ
jgi:hypothetical protein